MEYVDQIRKIAQDIKATSVEQEKVAEEATPDFDVVEKEAMAIIEEMEKAAAEEDAKLSDKAVETLGLKDAEKEEEEDKEEEEKDDEDEDEAEEKEASDQSAEEIKVAQERLAQAFEIEKEAADAVAEAQLMKVAAARVLARAGAIEASDIEKIASLSYEDL